jgi:dephospho-CoA kinase
VTTVLGLTGSFGSGKSTVAALLREKGAALIDADQLAREAVAPGSTALAAIAREFGPEVTGLLDPAGHLRRKVLAQRVFGDRHALARLNALLHPHVLAETRRRIEALQGQAPLIVVDVPLLFETGMQGLMDQVAVVTISENQRFYRLRRRGYSEHEIIARLGMQMPQAQKQRLAQINIDISGTIEATRKQVQALLDHITREKSQRNDESKIQ